MKKQIHHNSAKGQSVIELLIGTLIFSTVATVMLSLYSINTVELSGFYNKGDVLTSATDAMNRIGLLTRGGRGFGDNFGIVPPSSTPMFDFSKLLSGDPGVKMAGINTSVTTSALLNGTAILISPTFPSAGDPYYGNPGQVSPPSSIYGGTWPMTNPAQLGSPSGPGAPPAPGQYTLSQDCFIVQVPVFVGSPPVGAAGGGIGLDPSADVGGAQGPNYFWPATWDGNAATTNGVMQAVDTYVFRVMPDPNVPGTYMMLECAFPACPSGQINSVNGTTYTGHPTNVTLSTSVPAIICKGIVGPLDLNNNIDTFSYVEKATNSATNTPPANGFLTSDYTGVIVNLELLKNQQGNKASVASFKTEYFVRNNSEIQLEGPPQQ